MVTKQRGYTQGKEALIKRLARIEGQARGIRGMVEDDRYCIDIITQIHAVQAALDKVALGLLDDHAKTCVAGAKDKPEKLSEMMDAVERLVRR